MYIPSNDSINITVTEIMDGFPSELRPFLLVEVCPLTRSFFSIIRALWEAAKIIQPTIRVLRQVNIIISVSPFGLNLLGGQLLYTTKPEVINACFNDLIFLDCNKMIHHPFEIQVTCILEELVHTFYNVSDEKLTTQIVALLLPAVEVKDGKYFVRDKD